MFQNKNHIKNFGIISTLYGLGALAAMFREIMLAKYFGVGFNIAIFRVTFAVPNMLAQSLAPAVLGVLIPVLVKAEAQNKENYKIACIEITRIIFISVIALSLLGIFTSSLQVHLLVPGFTTSQKQLAAHYLTWMWLFFFIVAISFSFRAILNTQGRFIPGASANMLISAIIAVGLYVANYLKLPMQLPLLIVLSMLGGATVLAVHIFSLPRDTFISIARSFFSRIKNRSHVPYYLIGPLLVTSTFHLFNTLPRVIDRSLVSNAGAMAVASIDYGYNIITVPGIFLGSALITLLYPSYIRAKEKSDAHAILRIKIITISSVITAIILSIIIFYFSRGIVTLFYAHGAFKGNAILITSNMLRWIALGLAPMIASMFYVQILIGASMWRALIFIGMSKLLIKYSVLSYLLPRYGLRSVGISFLVCEASMAILAAIVLKRLTTAK